MPYKNKECEIYHKEYRATHKKEIKEYYEKHKEEIIAHRREYRKAHKKEMAARDREYRKAHREEITTRGREYRKAHREEITTREREYRKTHKIEIQEKSRNNSLKRNFGITLKEYDQLLVAQNGVCAICGHPPNGRCLSVDHDHITRKVRGLLCTSCNIMLGNAYDDKKILASAIDYLGRSDYENE